jgi:regulatory protein
MTEPSDSARCYDSALRILTIRSHSKKQLRTKLLRKKFDEDLVDDTIVRVTAEGWLNEERFAGDVVRARVRKLHGPRRITRELQNAGVSGEVARQSLREHVSDDQLVDQLNTACDKKLRAMARRYDREYLQSDDGRNKLANYLLGQGYDSSAVITVVDSALKALP